MQPSWPMFPTYGEPEPEPTPWADDGLNFYVTELRVARDDLARYSREGRQVQAAGELAHIIDRASNLAAEARAELALIEKPAA